MAFAVTIFMIAIAGFCLVMLVVWAFHVVREQEQKKEAQTPRKISPMCLDHHHFHNLVSGQAALSGDSLQHTMECNRCSGMLNAAPRPAADKRELREESEQEASEE